MTLNQEKLIKFINKYRARFGTSPTLQEMVSGIGVSDHKSVSGIVSALIKQGYLEKGRPRVRSILLTNKALEFLEIPLLRRQRLEDFDLPYQHPARFGTGSTVTLPTLDFLGYGNQPIEAEGTALDKYIGTVVEMAISKAIGGNLDGSFLNGINSLPKGHWTRLMKEAKSLNRLTWTISIPLLTWALSMIGFSLGISFALSLIAIWFIKNVLGE